MISYELSSAITKLGFGISFIANFILIHLTIFHIKKVTGTYKKLVIVFSICGILFTAMEIIARPFSHNTNQGLLYFSFNNWIESQTFMTFVIASWAGFYIQIISFVTIQFVYRYICLFNAKNAKKFDGSNSIFLIGFPCIPGVSYVILLHLLCLPDEFTDDFFRNLTLEKYEMEVTDIPRLPIVPYTYDGHIRWANFMILVIGSFITCSHYMVMIYCGLKMHFNMKKELKKFSACHQKLQMQFFKAIVAQSVGPTLFLVLPIAPILLSPLIPPILKINIDWETGWFFSMIGSYSPFDSIAFMMIVTEYRNVLKKMRRFGGQSSFVTTTMTDVLSKRRGAVGTIE